MMRQFFVALAVVLAIAQTSPAAGLDCAKATQPIEKMLCSTAELRKADDDMSAAYFKLLRETKDPDFHAALIRSQQRWLKVRSSVSAILRMGDNDKPDDREILLIATRERLAFLTGGTPIRTMEVQRKIAAKDSGGPLAGYTAWCELVPPPYGGWNYVCWTTVHRQHHVRICSGAEIWASGHYTDYRLVSLVKNGQPTAVAGCSIGTMPDAPCPDFRPPLDGHWTTTPSVQAACAQVQVPAAEDLWKYDPDVEPPGRGLEWMDECLFAPVFPPPELSRPN